MLLSRHLRIFLRHLTVLLLLAMPGAFSLAQVSSESQLKAAFLVNFMKYVEWPESRVTTANICLFGRNTLGGYLAAYEGRSVGGRELRVHRITGPDQVAQCQMVFIPDTEEARFGVILRWVDNLPVLTVSDAEVFTQQGGAISLVRSDGRLQFDINMDALNRHGLKPHSQMMRLAHQVTGKIR
ncbi:MAG: YfiR family protein [Rhodocyclaceae bacterium]|nr:YfiR family protein [Rhodocyclaceae bacterium]